MFPLDKVIMAISKITDEISHCLLILNLINLFVAERCGIHFKSAVPEDILRINFISTCYEIALRWMLQNAFHDKSTLVQVMAWWLRSSSHYMKNADIALCCHVASLGHTFLCSSVAPCSRIIWVLGSYLSSGREWVMDVFIQSSRQATPLWFPPAENFEIQSSWKLKQGTLQWAHIKSFAAGFSSTWA